jgi:hypothetical protein
MERLRTYREGDKQMEHIDVVITFSSIDEASQACVRFTHLGFFVTYHESMDGAKMKVKLPKQALAEAKQMINQYGGDMDIEQGTYTSTNQAEQQQTHEGYMRIPAHLIHDDWMDEWVTLPPEIASDILLSDEESVFDPQRMDD